MTDTSNIRRRLLHVEHTTNRLMDLVTRWVNKLRPRRVNTKSSSLTPGEIAVLRERMKQHGMDDDEASDWRTRSGETGAKR